METLEKLRVPLDPAYTDILGKAVYVFAYYEWAIIYIIQEFKPGFVEKYCRGNEILTSGKVKHELQSILDNEETDFEKISKDELHECCEVFDRLVKKRNALIHAHPITDMDGSQILNFQASTKRPIPDMKWSINTVAEALAEFDKAACNANGLLYRIRGKDD